MALAPEQRKVVRRIVQIGRQVGASPKEIKAAIETGAVESNFTNPTGGDADSAGWRQERASLYKDPTNLDAAIRRFYTETSGMKGKYGRAGDLAAAVQRPAAQYRSRYQQHSGEADQLLAQFGAGGGTQPQAPASRTTTSRTVGGVDNSSQRRALIAQFLSDKSGDPLDFAMGIHALQDIPGRTVTTTTGGSASSSGATGGSSKLVSRANAINAKKLPYQWGGGHGGKVDAYNAQPLDCSGAVSAVLGINPRVASQFEAWGKPGEGGNVTIYANSHHVLMRINGHFFGTSQTNPGGGAGWIPQGAISPEYLKGFTARHS